MLVCLPAAAVSAHPTDELLQQLYVTPTARGVDIDVDLTPGVLVGPAVSSLIDTNGDGAISDAESAAHSDLILDALTVTANGEPLASTSSAQPTRTPA